MACYTDIASVANTVKKFHIQSDLHSGYMHNFNNDKRGIIDELFVY